MTVQTPFVSVQEAARQTGLSCYYIRQGLRDGSIPHIRSGNRFKINLTAWLRQLDAVEVEQHEE